MQSQTVAAGPHARALMFLACALWSLALAAPAAAGECDSYRDAVARLEGEKAALESAKSRAFLDLTSGRFCSKCERSQSEIEDATGKPFSDHLEAVKGSAVPASSALLKKKMDEFDRRIDARRRDLDEARKAHSECESSVREAAYERKMAEEARAKAEARRRFEQRASEAESKRKQADAEAEQRKRDAERKAKDASDAKKAAEAVQRERDREAAEERKRNAEAEAEAQRRLAEDRRAEADRASSDAIRELQRSWNDFVERAPDLPLQGLRDKLGDLHSERDEVLSDFIRTDGSDPRYEGLERELDEFNWQVDTLSAYIRARMAREKQAKERERAREQAAAAAAAAEAAQREAERQAEIARQEAARQAEIARQAAAAREAAANVAASESTGVALPRSMGGSGRTGSAFEDMGPILSVFADAESLRDFNDLIPAAEPSVEPGRTGSGSALADLIGFIGSDVDAGGVFGGDPAPGSWASGGGGARESTPVDPPQSTWLSIMGAAAGEGYRRTRDARLHGPDAVSAGTTARVGLGALDFIEDSLPTDSIPASVRVEADMWRMLFLPRVVGDTFGAADGHVAFAERWVFGQLDLEPLADPASAGGASVSSTGMRPSGPGGSASDPSSQPSSRVGVSASTDASATVASVGGGRRVRGALPATRPSTPRMAQAQGVAQWASRAESKPERSVATAVLLESTDASSWPDAPRSALYLHAAAAIDLGDREACRKALAVLEQRGAHLHPSEEEQRILKALRRMQ